MNLFDKLGRYLLLVVRNYQPWIYWSRHSPCNFSYHQHTVPILLTLTFSANRLIGPVWAMINSVAKQLRMDAKSITLTSKVSASVLWILDGGYLCQQKKRNHRLNLEPNRLSMANILTTSLKPFESVPQLSVTYFNVIWFVFVNKTPTDCFVFRHEMSAYRKER
jgi:hypothetical protein